MADETSTTDDTQTDVVDTTKPDEASDLGDAGKKALEAERSRAKEAERRAKAAERALEAEKAKNLTDTERQISEAKAAGRTEAAQEAGQRLARAEIRAAAAAKGIDVTEILEDLNLSRFVGDDGEPDEDAITAAVSRWAAITPPVKRPRGDVDQGQRGTAPPKSNAAVFADFFSQQLPARQ